MGPNVIIDAQLPPVAIHKSFCRNLMLSQADSQSTAGVAEQNMGIESCVSKELVCQLIPYERTTGFSVSLSQPSSYVFIAKSVNGSDATLSGRDCIRIPIYYRKKQENLLDPFDVESTRLNIVIYKNSD
jgi:hypothetical protein